MDSAVPGSRFGHSDQTALNQLLEDKDAHNTKKATKAAMNVFIQYLLAENRDVIDFETADELCAVLCKFYADARKKDGTHYKLSALKSIRFGLSRHFLKEMEIDIIKDIRFKKANDIFKAVTVQLKRQGLGKTDHTPSLDQDDLGKLYGSIALNTDTPCGLLQKVWFDIMFYLCRRGRENLRGMNKTTFGITQDSKGREYVFQVVDELDKNHRETDDTITEAHMYAVNGHPLCPVASFRKYLSKLHPRNNDLWQKPVDQFTDSQDVWYQNQSLGKNTLSGLMRNISKQAGLSREFTNHSIRATSITVLDIKKFSDRDIMSVSGHKSENSIKNYTGKVSSTRRFEMSSALSASVITDNNNMQFQVHGELQLSQEQIEELMEPMDINNVQPESNAVDIPFMQAVPADEPIVIPPIQATSGSGPNVIDKVLKPIENMPFTPMISNCNVTFNVNIHSV